MFCEKKKKGKKSDRKEKTKKKVANVGVGIKSGADETKKVGQMMERLTCKKEEGGKTEINSVSKHWLQFSTPTPVFIQTTLESNYPMQATNRALLWLAD